MSDTRRLPQARLRSAWRDCCADYLRIVWKLPRIHFLAEGFKGVGEVAKCGYGQFSEDPRTIPLARFSFPPAPSCLVPNRLRILRESVANRWRIGQENSLGQSSERFNDFSRRALTDGGL